MTAYRDPAPKPAEPPQSVEEQIASDVVRMTKDIDADVRSQGHDWYDVPNYIDARLEAHRRGYGPFRLSVQHLFTYEPGHTIIKTEREWAEQTDRSKLIMSSRLVNKLVLAAELAEKEDR